MAREGRAAELLSEAPLRGNSRPSLIAATAVIKAVNFHSSTCNYPENYLQ